MKSKLYFFVGFLSISVANEAFAAKGLIIKLDVTDLAQDTINKKIRVPAGMHEKSARHHVTVGYIEENLPDDQMHKLGKDLIAQLKTIFPVSTPNNHIKFDVQEAARPFGKPVVLIPVNEVDLRDVNKKINTIVQHSNHQLNELTQPNNYIPHMTLSPKRNDAQYLPGLNQAIATHKKQRNRQLFFKLVKFNYTVIK